MFELQHADIADLSQGAAFLGAGGGGDPYIGRLILEQVIDTHGPIQVMDLQAAADDDLLVATGMMGAPTVMIEKVPNGGEAEIALRQLEKYIGRKASAIMPFEIGGLNALLPIALAGRLGLPVLDCDFMGRAFPELQMVTPSAHGMPIAPLSLCDETGAAVLIETDDNKDAERLARHIIQATGAVSQICGFPASGAQVKACAVAGTLGIALNIGRCIRQAREAHRDPFAEIAAYLSSTDYYRHARVITDGKIIDIQRETRQGFSVGQVTLKEFETARTLIIRFQNENLIVETEGEALVMVPDLITVLDRETGAPITTESLKFGQRVKVMGISAPPALTSPQALNFWGPRAFGLDREFTPLEDISPA